MKTTIRVVVGLMCLFPAFSAVAQTTPTPADIALRKAAWEGQIAAVESALRGGAAANAASSNGVTPLMLAAARGYKDVVALLLAKGADVNAVTTKDWVSALLFAAWGGHTAVADLLLDSGADIDYVDHGTRNAVDWIGLSNDSVTVEQARALAAHLKDRGAVELERSADVLHFLRGLAPNLRELLDAAASE